MINQCFYRHSTKNGIDNNSVRIFYHSLRIGFLIITNFDIYNMNCDKYILKMKINENSESSI